MKTKGISKRKATKILEINRKTVAQYWNEYLKQSKMLLEQNANIKEVQENLCETPIYNSSTRKPRKYTDEINEVIE